jgi:hypothetical protein
MAKLNQKMTYPVPDTYLSQSMAAGNTATLDYLGPDTIWVDVFKEDSEDGSQKKGTWTHLPIKTNYLDDGDLEDYDNEDQTAAIEALPVPLDSARIKIDCTKDTHICAIWAQPHCTGDTRGSYDKLPQVQDKLADGTVYYERPRNDSIPPDHVWNRDESSWNFDTKEWDLVLHQEYTTWVQIREDRNNILIDTDIKELLPEGTEKERWANYRQELRDLPQTYDGIEPHTVPAPVSPEDEDNRNKRLADPHGEFTPELPIDNEGEKLN